MATQRSIACCHTRRSRNPLPMRKPTNLETWKPGNLETWKPAPRSLAIRERVVLFQVRGGGGASGACGDRRGATGVVLRPVEALHVIRHDLDHFAVLTVAGLILSALQAAIDA